VEGYDQKTMHLRVERRRLLALPGRRSNEEAANAGHRALQVAGILRASNYDDVSVSVCAGVANLSGHVRTATDILHADSAVREVPGMREVQNHLVADDDLVNQVAQALARDERTRRETIFVAVNQGVVILSGLHNSSKARAAAEECAGQVSSVRGVSNYIEALGAVVDAAHERVVQPLIGQEVFASDMSLGRVERVVIDPTNRRVVAAVVGGQLPSREPANLRLRSYEMRTEDRRLVVSAADIAAVTPTEVQLNINGAAAAGRDDFAPGNFVQPNRAWRPPYPFTAEECLWARS
jgi:osmotically-inducible protein OsmY